MSSYDLIADYLTGKALTNTIKWKKLVGSPERKRRGNHVRFLPIRGKKNREYRQGDRSMTYNEWLEEKKRRGTELQRQRRLIKEAAAKCSAPIGDDLSGLLQDLDALFADPEGEIIETKDLFFEQEDREPMTEARYAELSESIANKLTFLISGYEPPVELLTQPKVADALCNLLDALGQEKKKYPLPNYRSSEARTAALAADPDTYAAQLLTMKKLDAKATPREYIRAVISIPRMKKDPAFKTAMSDMQIRGSLSYEDPSYFITLAAETHEQYEKDHALTFKEHSDALAKKYRAGGIKYPDFELNMKALRALAAEKEKDSGKWDAVRITDTELRNKRAVIRQAEADKQVERENAAQKSFDELNVFRDRASKRKIRTTAKELYDQLTREYKAGGMNYTLYEARLKVMREYTKGDKTAKVDLQVLDEVLDARLKESLGPLEKATEEITKAKSSDPLVTRLENICNAYGIVPVPDKNSLNNKRYTQEEFNKLKQLSGDHLKIDGVLVGQRGFAALAMGATQADPKLGCVYFLQDEQSRDYRNVITENDYTDENLSICRHGYMTDVDTGPSYGARDGIQHYFRTTIEPARLKVDEALRAYNDKGSVKELGKIIGLGIHQIINHTQLINLDSKKFNEDALLEGAILGKMAELAGRDPKLKKEVERYASAKELEQAAGMGAVYKVVRDSRAAKAKLMAADGEKPLTEAERKACVELMLREKVLANLGYEEGRQKYTEKDETELLSLYYQQQDSEKASDDRNEQALDAVFSSARIDAKIQARVGLPGYLGMMGAKGPLFARELLEQSQLNRDKFMAGKSNEQILEALGADPGSTNDPFYNASYKDKERYYREDEHLNEALREYKAKTGAPQQKNF